MGAERFHKMVNMESGLLGISETSSGMRDLLKQEQDDPRAAEAVALFCFQARKWIGALTVTLEGLDTLVFPTMETLAAVQAASNTRCGQSDTSWGVVNLVPVGFTRVNPD